MYEGVSTIKKKVNELVNSRTKEEYHKVLCQIEDLTSLSYFDPSSEKAKFKTLIRDMYVKKRDKDIITNTDLAKAINQRIADHKEMWQHQEKRNLIRSIRKAAEIGDKELVKKLETEFRIKYGRSNTRSR
jgi:hypothetical protein